MNQVDVRSDAERRGATRRLGSKPLSDRSERHMTTGRHVRLMCRRRVRPTRATYPTPASAEPADATRRAAPHVDLDASRSDTSDRLPARRDAGSVPDTWLAGCISSSPESVTKKWFTYGRQASTWRPSAPQNQADESGLRRIDVELPASLSSQCWSILSRGRLPDLG